MCVPMPTHCYITCFGFHARWIDGVECGLFSNHAPLGQIKYLFVNQRIDVLLCITKSRCLLFLKIP